MCQAIASTPDLFDPLPPLTLQHALEMPDVLIHHAEPARIVPAQSFLQELTFRHHLTRASGEVHQERVLAIGEEEGAVGQEDPVAIQLNYEVAKAEEKRLRHDVHQTDGR